MVAAAAAELAAEDVCVMRLLTPEEVGTESSKLHQDLRSLPGFDEAFAHAAVDDFVNGVPHRQAARFSLGGFGAVNTRSECGRPTLERVMPVLVATIEAALGARRIKEVRDRLVIRLLDTMLPSESWHRDILDHRVKDRMDRRHGRAPRLPCAGERVIQGWLNFGPGDTSFTCSPGTALHRNAGRNADGANGFAKMSREEAAVHRRASRTLVIRPGEVVLFDQTIAHAVAAGRTRLQFARLHFAFWVTDDPEELWADEEANAAAGLPSRLPSGQHVGIITNNFRTWPACVRAATEWLARRPFAPGFGLDAKGFLVRM